MASPDLYEYLRADPDEELIKDWDLATYSEDDIPHAVFDYTAGVWLPTRDVIYKRGLDE